MPNFKFSQLFASGYRTVLFDLAALIFNVFGLWVLIPAFDRLAAQSLAGNPWAKATVAGFCLSAAFLQPLGAVLKFHRAHQRNPNLQAAQSFLHKAGCLPVAVYYALQFMFLLFGTLLLTELRGSPVLPPGLFAALFVGLPLAAGINTLLVWLYFSAPATLPTLPFLQSAPAEWLGDGCIFLNQVGYQVWWWYLLADPYFSTRPGSLGGVLEKLVAFSAMLVLFYVPPRIFYWAEDLDLKMTGLRALLANVPILVRVFFGS